MTYIVDENVTKNDITPLIRPHRFQQPPVKAKWVGQPVDPNTPSVGTENNSNESGAISQEGTPPALIEPHIYLSISHTTLDIKCFRGVLTARLPCQSWTLRHVRYTRGRHRL